MLETHGKRFEISHLEIVQRFAVPLHYLKNLSENSIDALNRFLDKYNCNHERKPSHVQFLKNIIKVDVKLQLLKDCLSSIC